MSFPNYNLNIPGRILFAFLPLAVTLGLAMKNRSFEQTNAIMRSGMDYVAFFLMVLILFLSVAASEPWARMLSKDKANVAQTRKASYIGAGFCVLLIAFVLFMHR